MQSIPTLLHFSLKKDARLIVIWQVVLAAMLLVGAGKVRTMFATPAAKAATLMTLKTPAMVAFLGKFSFSTATSTASAYAALMLTFMALLVCLMNVALARQPISAPNLAINELLRARAEAPALAVAAALELILVSLLTAGVLGSVMWILPLPGTSLAASALFGGGLAGVGLVFGSLTLLLAILFGDNTTLVANGLVGIAFLARMLTDLHAPRWTGLTVLGLVEKLTTTTPQHWSLIGGLLVISLILLGLAVTLSRGLPEGHHSLLSFPVLPVGCPLTLIVRENRKTIIGWLLALLVIGGVYGSLFGEIGNLAKTTPALRSLIGSATLHAGNQRLIFAFVNRLVGIMASLASIGGIVILLKLNRDERRGALEQLHALPIARRTIFTSYLTVAMTLTLMANLLAITSLIWIGRESAPANSLHASQLWRILPGSLAANAVVIATVALIVGFFPRLQVLSWLLPIGGIFCSYLAPLLQLPQAIQHLTPYGWLNEVPAETVHWSAIGGMLALTLALCSLASLAYQRRDLTLS